jgi:hypothetical protein
VEIPAPATALEVAPAVELVPGIAQPEPMQAIAAPVELVPGIAQLEPVQAIAALVEVIGPAEPARAPGPAAAGTELAAVRFNPGPGAETEAPSAVPGAIAEAAPEIAAHAARQAWELRGAAAVVGGAAAGAGGNQT